MTGSKLTITNPTSGGKTSHGVPSSDLTFQAHQQWLQKQPNNKKATDNEKPHLGVG